VLDGKRLASKRGCKFIEVSAFLDHRVDELLAGVVAQVRLRQLAVDHRSIAAANTAVTTPHDGPGAGRGRCDRLRRVIIQLWSRWTQRCLTGTCRRHVNYASNYSPVANCDNLFLL